MKALIPSGWHSLLHYAAYFAAIVLCRQSFAQNTDLYEGSPDRSAPRGTRISNRSFELLPLGTGLESDRHVLKIVVLAEK
jgi:hypothetical protein